MVAYSIEFGIKTRSGCGAPVDLIGLLSGVISGTGAADWALTADGSIAPSGTYQAFKSFSLTAGQTYNLTVGADTVDILMVAAAAHVTAPATDTYLSNQLKTILGLAYNASGALVLGDTVYMRDGTVYDYQSSGALNSISMPTTGFGGAGTITAPGAAYTNGTYTNLSATTLTGAGASALLTVVVTGGAVAHVHLNDPGLGYETGDTITATIPGGSGFVFTVGANWSGEITVRSETPNTSTLADGNLRRGGGATITAVYMDPKSAAPRAPIHLKYIDWVVLPGTRSSQLFMAYRSTTGYGISASYNYCTVPDEIAIVTSTRIIAFGLRPGGTIANNYFYRCRRAALRSGIGCYDQPTNSIPIPDNTTLDSTFHDNVLVQCNGDGISVNGTKNVITDNFGFDWRVFGTSHQDCAQHTGFRSLGVTVPDVGYVARNVYWRGVGNGTVEPQGIFFTDTNLGTLLGGVTFENNLLVSGAANQLALSGGSGPLIQRNTAVNPQTWPDYIGALTSNRALLNLYRGVGGLVDKNIVNTIAVTDGTDPQTGVTVTADNVTFDTTQNLAVYFASPAYELRTTKAAVVAAFSPLLDGPAKNADGTYNGALFPDGSWNDGSVYQATPPTTISQSANISTVAVNQPVIITYQLDAAANLAVTVTPGLSGVTGDFSAATAVIGVGETSAQLTFTPTSDGTATLTAADDRSLAGPASIEVTVTPAVDAPTAYTQVPNRVVTTIGGAIVVTYTLNAVATAPVVITPGVTGVTGAFSSPTVTIPFGQDQGEVTFFAGSAGSGQLTASDDSGLTDPPAIDFDVSVVSAAQLIMLGIR